MRGLRRLETNRDLLVRRRVSGVFQSGVIRDLPYTTRDIRDSLGGVSRRGT
jgi:hypothetical protein